jgi:hypothetical protein
VLCGLLQHDKSQKKKCRYKGDLNSDGLPEGKGRLQIFSANFVRSRCLVGTGLIAVLMWLQ